MLRFLTAGESHGPALGGIIDGLPAGLEINEDYINRQLSRRQKGHGRGKRMAIETDTVKILSGVRHGKTLGSPVFLIVENRDYSNWQQIMSASGPGTGERQVFRPRPGHADLAGGMKYGHEDLRNVLERASARETAMRVAVGAVCRRLLEELNIMIYSQVVAIGQVRAESMPVDHESLPQLMEKIDASPVHCYDEEAAAAMMAEIDTARVRGESLGGCFEIGALNIPPGLGSYTQWDRRLDSRLAGGLMSIPAVKAVEVGDGVAAAGRFGSQVHDQIYYEAEGGIRRSTNRAGGIEGGVSNGETVWVRCYMKPIPTLYNPLTSVNIRTWQEEQAQVERSDICAVPAAAVIGEAVAAWVIAGVLLEKFGGDTMQEIKTSYKRYLEYLRRVWKWERTSF
ncbi:MULTISPECIES: chorismate synthase [Syntrophothermus]|uniref:Chorismate synthase n=1 Tax=Syntrophothermus lipocalidus (strain DSM 12680 / TGB-C1) TaxID=643648 RepID=D7CKE7_SYNLT|nr:MULTISPECIES: chorismate synthase [Syntrophothermus]ADI01182.1 chorismate synthase [Syntrophothermus lipocalidus DSM 12680]NSW81852.1 chorismate synthase [Syntrophothermus sp.]